VQAAKEEVRSGLELGTVRDSCQTNRRENDDSSSEEKDPDNRMIRRRMLCVAANEKELVLCYARLGMDAQ